MADEIVLEWLASVELDLRTVRNCLFGPEPTPISAAYHCQQAAEKLAKAVLISSGIHPRKSHDIAKLVAELEPSHAMRQFLMPLARLTPFAWTLRYPSLDPMEAAASEPSIADVTAWLEEINSVVRAVEEYLGIAPSRT